MVTKATSIHVYRQHMTVVMVIDELVCTGEGKMIRQTKKKSTEKRRKGGRAEGKPHTYIDKEKKKEKEKGGKRT